MSVKIRLRRMGRTNAATFRVVATDARSPRDGRFIETLGWYDPKQEGTNFKLDLDRVNHWESKGAQISDTVNSLVRRARRMVEADETAETAEADVTTV